MNPLDKVVAALEARGHHVKNGSAKCPAHDDKTPSLSIGEGGDGRALLHCHGGCSQEAVIAALGLKPADLFIPTTNGDTPRREVARYRYVDADGNLIVTVIRFDPKDFLREPKGITGIPLYNLPNVTKALTAGEKIWWPEGERDVEHLRKAGITATTTIGGVKGAITDDNITSLKGAIEVVIVADKDDPGYTFALKKYRLLEAAGIPCQVVEAATGKDATDHLAAKHGVDQFVPANVGQYDTTSGSDPVADVAPVAHSSGMKEAELLNDVENLLRRWVAFTTDEAAWALTLWIAHTHTLDAFESTPRLALISAEKGSGKTRTLEVLDLLVPNPIHTINMSAAALFRLVAGDTPPTLLMDEADTYLGPLVAKNHEELRGLINAGHRRGAVAYRCDIGTKGVTVKEYPAFAPCALASIGDLPDTIIDRSILIAMKRRAPNEQVEPFRQRPATALAAPIKQALTEWGATIAKDLADYYPDLPDTIIDRAADVWEPLIAIADKAGDHWPERSRQAATKLHASRVSQNQSLGVLLLVDVRRVFDEGNTERLSTTALLEKLNALDESPWGNIRGHPLDARGLARRLRKYDIRPGDHRFSEGTRKGYLFTDFYDAWTRYAPECLSSSGNGQQGQQEQPPPSPDPEEPLF